MATSTRDYSRLLLGFEVTDGQPFNATSAFRKKLLALGLVIDDGDTEKSPGSVQHTWRHLWVRDAKRRKISNQRIKELPTAIGARLSWAAPVVRTSPADGGALGTFLPDVLLIAARPGSDPARVSGLLSAHGWTEDTKKSRYLGRWRYFTADTPGWQTSSQAAALLTQKHGDLIAEARLEFLGHASALLIEPDDEHYHRQWALPRIDAPRAWDLSTGAGIVVAVIDTGCDLSHPQLRFAEPGINLDTGTGDGSPVGPGEWEKAHGTLVAGIIGAGLNDRVGVAGLAGGCTLLPLATSTYTHTSIAMGIRYAVEHGARVINMSFQVSDFGFASSALQEAIEDAAAAGIVLCASTGNANIPPIFLPARHPAVIPCGASDGADRRWSTPASRPPAGSNYGDSIFLGQPVGVAVVAPGADYYPGIDIYSTDISGPGGRNPGGSPYGDQQYFNATSAATPHVSAVAALLLSRYPALTAADIRGIITRTAEKTGGYVYIDVPGYPLGTRHIEMGYGRLNAFRALDLGDVMIADWPGDNGLEPSTPPAGNFWSTSDLVIRPADDGIFEPSDPLAASVLVPGRDHTVYVRVRNLGPADARNVHVETRVTPWVGLEFSYPADWTEDNPLHLRPAPVEADFALIPVGGSVIARFTLTAAQVDLAAGWGPMGWHPCILGIATSDNDYAFQTSATGARLQMLRNNLVQRNLTVMSGPAALSLRFPFVLGHPASPDRTIELVIESGRAARDGKLQLVIDDNGAAFPQLVRAKAFAPGRLIVGKIAGGKLTSLGKRRVITLDRSRTSVQLSLPRAGRFALNLVLKLPRDAKPTEQFALSVAQRSERRGTVGGAKFVYVVSPQT